MATSAVHRRQHVAGQRLHGPDATAPNRTSAFMGSWQNDLSGNTFSSNALTGRTGQPAAQPGLRLAVVSMRVSEQDVQDASRQVDAARSEAVAASSERSSVLAEAFTNVAKLRSSRSSNGSTSSSFEQFGETPNRLGPDQQERGGYHRPHAIAGCADCLWGIGPPGRQHPIASLRRHSLSRQELHVGPVSSRAESPAVNEQRATRRVQAVRRPSLPDRSFMSRHRQRCAKRRIFPPVFRLATRSGACRRKPRRRSAFAERVSTAYERGETISIDIAGTRTTSPCSPATPSSTAATTALGARADGSGTGPAIPAPHSVFSDGTAVPTWRPSGPSPAELRRSGAAPDLTGAPPINQSR